MDSKRLSLLIAGLAILILPALIGALIHGTLAKVIVSPFASLFAISTLLPLLFFLIDYVLEKSAFLNARMLLHIKLIFYYASFIIPYAVILFYTEEKMSDKVSPFVLIWYCIISSFFLSFFLPFIFRSRIKEYHFNQLRIYIPLGYLLFCIIAIFIQPNYFSSIELLALILLTEFVFYTLFNALRRVPA
ncbi:MAG: hypothetical protein P4L45_13645 [Ignavibacteriaceae bacterium]|nr:hypothetical protein [Ignavibacteriaceae bacterium]